MATDEIVFVIASKYSGTCYLLLGYNYLELPAS